MTTFKMCVVQLEALLRAENAALSRMDVGAVAALTAEKNRLANLLRDLLSDPSHSAELGEVGPVLSGLSSASDDNKKCLERAMLVQRRLMAIVVSAARPPATGYGKSGSATAEAADRPRAIMAQA